MLFVILILGFMYGNVWNHPAFIYMTYIKYFPNEFHNPVVHFSLP